MSWILNFLYNLDRAGASLFGAKPEETISSEIGEHERHRLDKAAADVLDAIQHDHVENSVTHAVALDQADAAYNAAHTPKT